MHGEFVANLPQHGIHTALVSLANRGKRSGFSREQVKFGLQRAAAHARRLVPEREIEDAVDFAFDNPGNHKRGQVPLSEIEFDPAKLAEAAAALGIPMPLNWRHWLWERSPVRPDTQTPLAFLSHCFNQRELIHVFDVFEEKEPFATVTVDQEGGTATPDTITDPRRADGIWFLGNPVDGKWHPNPRQGNKSCRSEESVTSFRYLVLESDEADPRLWLALIVQLRMRVVAIYTSGGRSIHVLVRIDAESKAHWDEIVQPLKRPFKVLGGDPAAMTAVRLTRLPGCWRRSKGGFQKLLYLNPTATETPIVELPVARTRAEELTRWKTICPKWARGTEAFQ